MTRLGRVPSLCSAFGQQSSILSRVDSQPVQKSFSISEAVVSRAQLHKRAGSRILLLHRSRQSTVTRSWTVLQSFVFAIWFSIVLCSRGVRSSNILTAPMFEGMTDLLLDRSEPPTPAQIKPRQLSTVGLSIDPTLKSASNTSSAANLPEPFDANLGNNFTASSCPAFFQNFLHSQEFQACRPFSLLLQTSNSFFEASRNPSLLAATLDASCTVDYPTCSNLMSSLAAQLKTTSACSADLAMQNPLVEQALAGLTAYDPLYHAGCLTLPDVTSDAKTMHHLNSNTTNTTNPTNSSQPQGQQPRQKHYCFVDSASAVSNPAGTYPYYLPLGLAFPSSGREPVCDFCLKATMAVLNTYAGNSSQPYLEATYGPAADVVNGYCGDKFGVAKVQYSGAGRVGGERPSFLATVGAAAVGAAMLLFF